MPEERIETKPFIGHYELVDVKTFLAVAEIGSMSKASTHLGITKSMASQRVSRLERALGVELLIRSSRGVTLTHRGALYRAQVSEGLALLDSAADSLMVQTSGLSGSLRLSAPMTFGTRFLSPLLFGFLELYEGLNLEVELHDHRVDLSAEGYDIGVRITNRQPHASEEFIPLAWSRRVVCCSPDYVQKNGVPTELSQLEFHSTIGYSNQESSTLWRFEGQSQANAFNPHSGRRLQTNNGEIMRDAALSGLGLTVLPMFIVADDLRSGRLVRVLPESEPQPDRIFAVCPARRGRRVLVRLLIEHLQEALRGIPPWERGLPGFRPLGVR